MTTSSNGDKKISIVDAHIKWLAEEAANGDERSARRLATLKLLTDTSNADVLLVQHWLKKHPLRVDWGIDDPEDVDEDLVDWPQESWEYGIISLSACWDSKPLEPWELASARERQQLVMRASRLASELADLLDDKKFIPLGSIHRHIDTDIRECFLREVWEDSRTQPPEHQKFTGTCDEFVSGWAVEWRYGFVSHLEKQRWSPLLRSLAKSLTQRAHVRGRDARPQTGAPDARVFARHLADEFFQAEFSRTPNEVIAACVRLRFPELDNRPDEATIRSWRGVK